MGLRLTEGVDLAELTARFGFAPDALIDAERFALYRRLQMVWRQGSRIGVTPAGMPVLDALLGELVREELVHQ